MNQGGIFSEGSDFRARPSGRVAKGATFATRSPSAAAGHVRVPLLLVLLASTLVACSPVARKASSLTLPASGNFLTSKIDPGALAVAAVKVLASDFPPAQTRLQLDPQPTDAFGMALVNQLREKGYAVVEPVPGSKAAADGSLVLRYVLDQQGTTAEDTTYRVLLQIGKATLARLYMERNGQFEPMSNWVRGELRR